MTKILGRFAREEEGNVTIDWIVLTAGLVGLSVAILASVGTSSANVATHTNGQIETLAASF